MITAIRRFVLVDDDHPLTGWHVLALVSAFFVTIIAVNLAMALFATHTFPGLVVENSYVASQHYDELLSRARAQEASGLVAELAANGGRLLFRLTGAKGEALRGLTVTAHVGRPSTAHEDLFLDFGEFSDGYRPATELRAGRWQVDMEASRGETVVFRETREIYVAPGALP